MPWHTAFAGPRPDTSSPYPRLTPALVWALVHTASRWCPCPCVSYTPSPDLAFLCPHPSSTCRRAWPSSPSVHVPVVHARLGHVAPAMHMSFVSLSQQPQMHDYA